MNVPGTEMVAVVHECMAVDNPVAHDVMIEDRLALCAPNGWLL